MLLINVNKIYPHPDNPRKNLGDLTELTESIKEQGILQNLTVVRNEDEEGTFKVVIGHRRLEAAKLAGKASVPCVISDMDYKTQVATMLLENMQRQDLTAYEQAQGFQMMLDLGATIKDIVRDTGLSETTVRHRIKLNELDPEKLKEKSANKNITMFELIKLEQLNDPEMKDKALEAIGTANFEYTFNTLIKEQEQKEYLDDVEKTIRTFAEEIDEEEIKSGDYEYSDNYDRWNLKKKAVIPSDKDECEYFYHRYDNQSIRLFTIKDAAEDAEQEAAKQAEAEERREREERRRRLDEILGIMKNLRMDYVKNIKTSVLKEHQDDILAEVAFRMGDGRGGLYKEILGISEPEGIQSWHTGYREKLNEELDKKIKEFGAIRVLTVLVYSSYNRELSYATRPFDYYCAYNHGNAKALIDCYRFLESIGYEKSDEEKKILDGTHELYVKPEEEEEVE